MVSLKIKSFSTKYFVAFLKGFPDDVHLFSRLYAKVYTAVVQVKFTQM